MAGEQRFYSEEEAQQILHRATTSVPATGMSREELVRAAGEMGISAEAIERAESEIAAQRHAELSAQEEARLGASSIAITGARCSSIYPASAHSPEFSFSSGSSRAEDISGPFGFSVGGA